MNQTVEPRWPGGNKQYERPKNVPRLDQLYIQNEAAKPLPNTIEERLCEPRWVGGARNDITVGYTHPKNVEECKRLYAIKDSRKSAAQIMAEAKPSYSDRRGPPLWPSGSRRDKYDGQPENPVESLMTIDDPVTKPRPGSSRRGVERWPGGASPDRISKREAKSTLTPLWTDDAIAESERGVSRRGRPRWDAGARPDLEGSRMKGLEKAQLKGEVQFSSD